MKYLIKYSEIILVTVFVAVAILFFGFYYQYHLHFQEQMQLFERGTDYLFKNLKIPGGLINYLGEFFTQFYYYPFVGAAIIAVLLIMVQQLFKNILFHNSRGNPLIFISFIPSVIYWALLCDADYYLAGIIGLILGLLAINIYIKISRKSVRIISGLMFMFLLYFLAGGIYLVFMITILIIEIVNYLKDKNSVHPGMILMILLISIVLPLIVRQFIIVGPILQTYISEYYYQVRIFLPWPLLALWVSVPFFLLISRIWPLRIDIQLNRYLSGILFLVFIAGSYLLILKSLNSEEESEMAYDYLVRTEKWDEIIAKSKKEKPVDQNSMVAVNLALAMKNQLSEQMFQYKQNPDYLFIFYNKHGLVSHIASDVYYQLGFINYAQMAAFESNESSINTKNSVRVFMRLAETSIIKGEYKQAEKYIGYLKNTLFYRNWANYAARLLYNDKKVENDPILGKKRKNLPKTDYFLNKDKINLILLRSLIDNQKNQTVYEYLMAYYLVNKNLDGFLRNFIMMKSYHYSKVPLVYQEALVYIYSLLQKVPDELKDIKIDYQVTENIRNYATLYAQGKERAQKLLEKDFGNTYWYYLHFTQIPSDTVKVEQTKPRE
ncbi:MAG: DUF6057 family protein [Bacteroidales bacterium]